MTPTLEEALLWYFRLSKRHRENVDKIMKDTSRIGIPRYDTLKFLAGSAEGAHTETKHFYPRQA